MPKKRILCPNPQTNNLFRNSSFIFKKMSCDGLTIDQILTEGENKQCFECEASNVLWANLSHGVFLCTTCSGTHRSFGAHLSVVRSLKLDAWSAKQIEIMKNGGNMRLKIFFQCYGIPHLPCRDKYFTNAADFYRQQLNYESGLTDDAPKKLELETAAEEMELPQQKEYVMQDSQRHLYKNNGNPFVDDAEQARTDGSSCETCVIF
jgi:hypothetical protein